MGTAPKPPSRRIPTPLRGRLDVQGVTEAFAHRMMYSVAKDVYTATEYDTYQGLAYAVRDRLMERWFATQDAYYRNDAKRVYYLSLEFLMGRALGNNIMNLGADPAYREAMAAAGWDVSALECKEWDAGLGNGGLGRLAACFVDSAATLALPFYGYGIRYEYGIFTQRIQDGQQVEQPDNWLRYGNPWEIHRPDALYPVRFHGRVDAYKDEKGQTRRRWVDTENVMAMAYDTPVAGYRNDTVNTLRLWSAKSSREFDLARFASGDYVRAVEDKTLSENISKVLYPPDDVYAGKELRLKQQYFFVSATLQDVMRRFLKPGGRTLSLLPAKVAIQLNDTHPAVAIPELMRLLVDEALMGWDEAWEITQKVFAYTNHTVLPEALEKWPADLFAGLLPRHHEIVQEIDRRLRVAVRTAYPGDEGKVARMAVCADDPEGSIRMANLAVVGSHSVNGVAALHTRLLQEQVFPDLHAFYPGRFNNKTNGITPRRWLMKCNPGLSALITEAIGEAWTTDLDRLRDLTPYASDLAFGERWRAVKHANKVAFSSWLERTHGLTADASFLFDCQVKRLHEYKRQLLNVLHVIALWNRLKDGVDIGPPRAVIFAGKAAPSYFMAKLVIRLIHVVGTLVGADAAARGRLAVVFVPNYSVSAAEMIFPGCELSEQISTAGTEASGTGNMKAALNGSLTIGTLDGANVEIREEVGAASFFLFGHTAEQVSEIKARGYSPTGWVNDDRELAEVIATIARGEIERAWPGVFQPLVQELTGADRYLLCADFRSYLETQQRAGATYLKPEEWTRMSILNVAGMGKFSSDRTIQQYATEVWDARPVSAR